MRRAPDADASSSLEVTVKASSLELTDKVRPADREEIENRMRREVLETVAYPEIQYRADEIVTATIAPDRYRLRIAGILSLHGVSNRDTLDAELQQYEDGVRLGGEFLLRHVGLPDSAGERRRRRHSAAGRPPALLRYRCLEGTVMMPESARPPSVLIAGVGNIFLGDDAFGVEVVERLAQRRFPEGVRVVDFGIRGLDLAYALLDGYDAVVLVDAMPRGGQPGTLYVIEPDLTQAASPSTEVPMMETHNLDPARVLQLVASLGGEVRRLVVVGCEPQAVDCDSDTVLEMSEPMRAAVDEAVSLVESLVTRLIQAVLTADRLIS